MEPVRPKISARPLHASSNCTKESAEEQYRREQEAIYSKGRRLQAAEQRLIGSLYPTAEGIKARKQEIFQVQQQQYEAQAKARQLERTSHFEDRSGSYQQQPLDCSIRPWTATSGTYSQEAERQARRRFAEQVAAENRALMIARAQQRKQQQLQEKQADQQAMRAENQFWNLGATSPAWISPEHRHLAPLPLSSPRAAAASATAAQPPWALHNESNSSFNTRQAVQAGAGLVGAADGLLPSQQGQPYKPQQQGMQHPWSWST